MANHPQHSHGSMDVREHERTFANFVRFVGWSLVVIFAVLIFLALADS
ncbi:MAG: aa3-type cytochrome c oxidase subunit IV [Rhodobacteraceae bacterium]|jgi:hypothetical protein|nr:aa3-type cytochrome c oxidase subunit IV [Paracoccaceae bacterium]